MNIQRIYVESENPLHHWNWLNVKDQVVLDLGCGFHFIEDGWDTTPEFFLKKGASKIIGLDPHLDDIEHFKQILSLESWLAPGALVGMDDTYLFNDCWIGKSGPGVVYLLSLGYTLEHYSEKFVILRKPA